MLTVKLNCYVISYKDERVCVSKGILYVSGK